MRKIKPPRVEPPEREAYSADESLALLAAEQQSDGAIWLLAIERDLRRSELLGLKWKDVDFERSMLLIRRQRAHVGGTLVEGPPKTDRSSYAVILPDRSLAGLKRWRRAQVEQRLKSGPSWRDQDWIFTDGRGVS